MSVYNKHVKLSLQIFRFCCNITITPNPPIKSILIINESTHLNSLQFNKHLHKVTYYLIGKSSKNRTLAKSFGDSCATTTLNSHIQRELDVSNSPKCSPKTSTAINLFILTFNESATQCNPDKTNYMLYMLHKEKPYS